MSFTVPVAFRRTLARELPSWRADGLVGETASLALTARYGLNRLAEPDDRWVARTFALLGAVAIGAGVLSFVAAHWGQLDALARFAIVATTAIAAYAAGLVLRGRGNTVFAEAALVAGSLAFGGAIALGAQEFNASLELWQVYALWGAGLVPLAFVLRSVPVGTVALAAGAASVPLHVGSFGHEMPFIHFAIASALAAVLARRFGLLWYRELALALAAVGVFIVLFGESTNAASAAIAGVAALALAAGAARSAVVAVGATVIAFLAALPATYWFAYNAGWQAEHDVRLGAAGVALLVAIAVAVWHVRRRDVLPLAPPAAALGAVILLPHLVTIGPIAGVLLANGLVLAVAGALVARGLAVRDRGAFLGGTGIAAFAGFLRFAEYDHDLTRKALAFVVVGIAFVAAAWLYERRPAREAAHAA